MTTAMNPNQAVAADPSYGVAHPAPIVEARVREATEVDELPTRLELALANLQTQLDVLTAHLAPILLSDPTAEDPGPSLRDAQAPVSPEQSEVSRRLQGSVHVINALAARVRVLTGRLDLSDPEEHF